MVGGVGFAGRVVLHDFGLVAGRQPAVQEGMHLNARLVALLPLLLVYETGLRRRNGRGGELPFSFVSAPVSGSGRAIVPIYAAWSNDGTEAAGARGAHRREIFYDNFLRPALHVVPLTVRCHRQLGNVAGNAVVVIVVVIIIVVVSDGLPLIQKSVHVVTATPKGNHYSHI